MAVKDPVKCRFAWGSKIPHSEFQLEHICSLERGHTAEHRCVVGGAWCANTGPVDVTGQQVCNECGAVYAPLTDDNPTNPLCVGCRDRIAEGMTQHRFAIDTALRDRMCSSGLMARMSDERFERYVVKELGLFHEWRNKLG